MENTTATITVPVTLPEDLLKPRNAIMSDGSPARLTYTRREAAQAMGVSLPTLAAFMNRKDNPLPHIRHGYKVILIPVAGLESWLIEEAARNAMSIGRPMVR